MDPELKAALMALEAVNTHGHSEAGRRIAELQKEVDGIQTAMQRPHLGGGFELSGDARTAKTRRDAFAAYIKKGKQALTAEYLNVLVVSDDTRGGYLAPAEFVAEVTKNIVLFSPIRAYATVRNTVSGEIKIPKRTGTMTGYWAGEVSQRQETEPTYGLDNYPVNEAAFYVDASNWMLEDASAGGIDMAAELASDAGEEAGRLEGTAFVNGTGNGQPFGILQDATIATIPSLSATSLTADGLINALYSLKPAYRSRSTWLMNGTTIAAVRKLKDGTGQYLWQTGIAAGQPDTLLGRPLVEAVDMPDCAAGAFPAVIADLSNYRIFDRLVLSMLRDPYSLATTGQTRFHFRRRVGGGVGRSEAFKKVICSAS